MPRRKTPRPKSGKSAAKPPVKQDQPNELQTENAKGEAELSGEDKLQKELNWCIDQLRLGIITQKSTQKQVQESMRLIKILASTSAPLVKKRQIMRQTFGDYRKKIADEEARWLKDVDRIKKKSYIHPHKTSEAKSTFIRAAGPHSTDTLTKLFSNCTINEEKADVVSNNDSQAQGNMESFKFNFQIPGE